MLGLGCRQDIHLVSGGGYWQWAFSGLGSGSGCFGLGLWCR